MKPFISLLPLFSIFLLMCCSIRNDEQDLRSFIDNHIRIIEPKLKALNLAYWNAAATGEKKYYDEQAALEFEVNTIYSNKKEFEQLKKWKETGNIKDTLLMRQLILFYNDYIVNQNDSTIIKKIADKSAAVQNKFNVFRPILESKELSDNDIENILKEEKHGRQAKKSAGS
ncbi:MAG: hypothetical protein JXA06_03455 [Bacteroidetes bacterium]|nr:hypothetical protein [Bacteroidota bacterium]